MGFLSDIKNFVEDAAPVVGAVGGFLIGGPAGAAAGGALGGAISGYGKTGHLGGTLEGAALGGIAGYGGAELYGASGLGSSSGSVLSGLSGTGASSSPVADAVGLMSTPSTVSQAALGLGTATAPGYALPATGGSLMGDLSGSVGSSVLGGASKVWGGSNLVSGLAQIYGSHLANQNAQQLQQMAQQSNAMGPYRAQYAQQLQQLMANPSSIQNLPGYQAGVEAINRDAAAKGYFGSGNMAASLGMYGNQIYNQQAQMLAGLAGSNISPAVAGNMVNSAGQSQLSGLGMLGSGVNTVMQ